MEHFDLKELFDKKINIEHRLKAISGIFDNEERINNTVYAPSYQRNYVWDDEKAVYFIETILIGSEIPPLIFYRDQDRYEVIDGRQRYETIYRFVKGELKLKRSGLQKLGFDKSFVGKYFHELDPKYQEMFWETRIRTIEYGFKGDSHSQEEESELKIEIFKRYNTGITPLSSIEVDRAVYFHNSINEAFREKLECDSEFLGMVEKAFPFEKSNIDVLLKEIRDVLVLTIVPVKFFASKTRAEIDKQFDIIESSLSEIDIIEDFRNILKTIIIVRGRFEQQGVKFNRLFSECLYWALDILEKENHELSELTDTLIVELVNHLEKNVSSFTLDRSRFHAAVIQRYKVTQEFFEERFSICMESYISQSEASSKPNNDNDITSKPLNFDDLRIHKVDPTSYDISDFVKMIGRQKILLRPSYQRKEVIRKRKASSIIESLLLGIKLPPIIVFKRSSGIAEVVDGQQRILSILGFLGKTYLDENGVECKTKNDSFKLQLKESILKEYDGKRFVDLDEKDRKTILYSAELWVIEISENVNIHFDPVDLFVRLNNRPFPIQPDSFEMWNSFIDREIIETLKTVTFNNKGWFYGKKGISKRMENENLITIFSYFQYRLSMGEMDKQNNLYPTKTMDVFMREGRVNCRLKTKTDISKMLKDEKKEIVFESINNMEFVFLSKLKSLLLAEGATNASELSLALDRLMCADNNKRTQQNLYLLWLFVYDLQLDKIHSYHHEIFDSIRKLYMAMSTSSSIEEYYDLIRVFKQKYCGDTTIPRVSTSLLCNITKERNDASRFYALTNNKFQGRVQIKCINNDIPLPENCLYFSNYRSGMDCGYINAILTSRFFYSKNSLDRKNLIMTDINEFTIPYISREKQKVISTIWNLLQDVEPDEASTNYLWRVLDVIVYELYYSQEFADAGIYLLAEVGTVLQESTDILSLYEKASNPKSNITLFMLRAMNQDFLINLEER